MIHGDHLTGPARSSFAIVSLLGMAAVHGHVAGACDPAETFRTFSFAPIPEGPRHAQLVDVDLDGDIDIVADVDEGIQVLLNTGPGVYAPQPLIDLVFDSTTHATRIADLNQDGHPDLVRMTSHNPAYAYSILGHGDGSYDALPVAQLSHQQFGFELADMTGDGIPDIVSTRRSPDEIVVSVGAGDGSFGAALTTRLPVRGHDLALGDLNGDGAVDVVVSALQEFRTFVYYGQGDGSFAAPLEFTETARGTTPLIVDIDLDDDPDILLVSELEDSLIILENDGNGGFAHETGASEFPELTELFPTDLNGDGLPDLAGRMSGSTGVFVALSERPGQIGPVTWYQSSFQNVDEVLATDLSGDDVPDIMVLSRGLPAIAHLTNDGSGTFDADRAHRVDTFPVNLHADDINGDGFPDLVTAQSNGEFIVSLGAGDGSLTRTFEYDLDAQLYAAAIADIDGDGHTDIAFGTEASTVPVFYGIGDGSFEPPVFIQTEIEDAWDIDARDLDADGHTDLIVAHPYRSTITILYGASERTFDRPLAISSVTPVHRLRFSDCTGDGVLDIVASSQWNPQFAVLAGDSNGGFYSAVVFPAPEEQRGFDIGDLDGDGAVDIVFAIDTTVEQFIAVYRGFGNGAFWHADSFADVEPFSPRLVDMNGDHVLDLIIGDRAGQFSIAYGNGDGTFTDEPTEFRNDSNSIVLIETADFDQNGSIDVAASGAGVNGILIALNQCVLCRADLDGSGSVDLNDLLAVLASWGPCPASCPTDLDASGAVDVGDVMAIIMTWGAYG